jgi:hypothetical protein
LIAADGIVTDALLAITSGKGCSARTTPRLNQARHGLKQGSK